MAIVTNRGKRLYFLEPNSEVQGTNHAHMAAKTDGSPGWRANFDPAMANFSWRLKMSDVEKWLLEFKKQLPEDAACKSVDHVLYSQCPIDCPYFQGKHCSLDIKENFGD